MKTQIPIYRAKKIDSDEYVDGYYAVSGAKHLIFVLNSVDHNNFNAISYRWWEEVDPSTLAIHFPDMIDSEGTKIFASLSEDDKGGDTLDLTNHAWDNKGTVAKCVSVYFDRSFGVKILNSNEFSSGYAPYYMDSWSGTFKVTGIQS